MGNGLIAKGDRLKSVPGMAKGFSLLELLLVMVILALTATLIVPAVGEGSRRLRVRNMVNQFALDLSAARWTAVSGGKAVDLVVTVDPANGYEYTDQHGRLRSVQMPDGVLIVSSTSPIQFKPNGSVLGGSTTVIESPISTSTLSRWTITTNVLGVSTTTHEPVAL